MASAAPSAPPEPVPMTRSVSLEVAAMLGPESGVSRDIARRAIDAAGGDVNEAVSNLMTNSLDPAGGAPPLVALARSSSHELAEFAGITKAEAHRHLEACGGDVEKAKRELLSSLLGEAEARMAGSEADAAAEREAMAPLKENAEEFECGACMDDIAPGDGFAVRACEHLVCKTCARDHVSAKMREGETVINCMHPGCGKALSQRELKALMGTGAFAVLDRRALEKAVAVDPTLHLCPTPDCTMVFSWAGPEDGLPQVKCPVCNVGRCIACGITPYHNAQNCGEAAAEAAAREAAARDAAAGAGAGAGAGGGRPPLSDAEDERLMRAYLKKSKIRVCKRCGNGVVKEMGCEKLKCRCGYRFCYTCGAENALCEHTPSYHGFIDNVTGRGDFSNLDKHKSPT